MTQTAQQYDFNELVYPVIVESRFGELVIQKEDLVFMPQGIYGFEEYANYALVPLPQSTERTFHVLQCLDQIGLIFLLTPLQQKEGNLLPNADLQEACEQVGAKFEDTAFYAITTVTIKGEAVELSLNLKAPIIHDKRNQKVWQFILEKVDFPIDYKLTLKH